jgi:glutamate--cysteine ligase
MPSPTRSLSVADVHHFVGEQVFPTATNDGSDRSTERQVGIELEWITIARDGRVLTPGEVGALLADLPGGSRVTFEPGGQLELSGPPAPGIKAAIAAMRADTEAARDGLARAGIDLVGAGIDTRGDIARVLHEPRYSAMEEYFDTAWPAGRTMMRNTASIQVNVDVGTPVEIDARWHRAHDLGPVLTACFANSPFDAMGRPSGFLSTRAAVWHAIDPGRTASARRHVAKSAAPDDWARYVLDAPVMMVRVDDTHSVAMDAPQTFEQWIVDGHGLGWPTTDDLAYHLTTLFPPVRPRGWLELRMIDALPEPWWPVAVAVTAALLDDPMAAEWATSATSAVRDRWAVAARDALHDPALADAARWCFDAAQLALERIGADAATIEATEEYAARFVRRSRCPADDLLDDRAGRPIAAR